MLKGLREKYLQEAGKVGFTEGDIAHGVFSRFNQIDSEAFNWRYLWQIILRFFHPSLNNVYFSGTDGDIRHNEIFASEPTTYLTEVTDFMFRAMFPEGYPWFGMAVYDYYGREVSKAKLSPAMLRHLQDAEDVLRDLLLYGNFYPEVKTSLHHFNLLGNAILRVTPWGKEAGQVRFTDCPVHRMGVQRDSMGQVVALAWTEAFERWEIFRNYGAKGWELFRSTLKIPANPGMYLNKVGRDVFGQGSGGPSMGGNPSMSASQALGTAQSPQKRNVEEVIRLAIPNNQTTGIPGGGLVFPEMQYVCYIITKSTKRLVDVEMYSDLNFGVASDTRVVGEAYGRGMCGRILPDVGVLNKKKKVELIADSITAQTPIVVAGPGLNRPIGNTLRPFQQIHAKSNTQIQPLFNADALMRRTKAIYEDEKLSVAEGLRRDKINLEMADRMTLGEFTQRRDISQSIFQPQAGVIYAELIQPVLRATLNYAYISGRLPTPPQDILLSGLKFRIKTYSMFSYGQNLEKGLNFSRAMAPLGDIPQVQPEILDNIDFNGLLRANLSSYGLADIINDPDIVARIRESRAEMLSKGSAGGNRITGEQKGRDKAIAEKVYNETTGPGVDDQQFVGVQ